MRVSARRTRQFVQVAADVMDVTGIPLGIPFLLSVNKVLNSHSFGLSVLSRDVVSLFYVLLIDCKTYDHAWGG